MLALSVLFCVLAIEGGLWLLDRYPPLPRNYPGECENRSHPTFEADAQLGWRTRPGLDVLLEDESGDGTKVRYLGDRHGRRTGPNRAAETATRRILLAGDSFLWAASVAFEDGLAGRLEAHFTDTRVENVAQPGFGLDQVVLSVERHILDPKPDLIVVGIYPHDVDRCLTSFRADLGFNKPTFVLRDGELSPMTAADRPGPLWRLVEDHSRLLGLWRRAQRNVGFHHGIGPWWATTDALLERLRATAAAAGVPLLLVHVPFFDWRPFRPLRDYCERHAVPLVDPVATDPVQPAGLYFGPDRHFTAAGHRYLTKLVVDWIEREGPRSLR